MICQVFYSFVHVQPKPSLRLNLGLSQDPIKAKAKANHRKAKVSKSKGKGKVQWLTDVKTKDGQWKQLCIDTKQVTAPLVTIAVFNMDVHIRLMAKLAALTMAPFSIKIHHTDVHSRNRKCRTLP